MDPFRLQKADAMRRAEKNPYALSFERTHTLGEARNLKEKTRTCIAGRIVLFRDMGGVTFATLQDHTGRLQIAFKEDVLGHEHYVSMLGLLDLGDFIGVQGERFTTQKGEPTILVKEWVMLCKSLRQPPEKWHGVVDEETTWRQRYLDLSSSRETFERFSFRSLFIRKLREFYWSKGFIEMETPVIVNEASGALAKPFKTHHDAYDLDMYLRIAPETFLKECLIGGFDRVFEVARVFRNEGLDPSHLQDFTMCEHYSAYWDYEKNMEFTEEMMETLLKELMDSTWIQIPNREGKLVKIDFKKPWPRVPIHDVILKYCSIDIRKTNTAADLRAAMKKAKIELDIPIEKLGLGTLIDQLYKKVARPHLVQPTFVTEHPLELSPLARRNDANPAIVDRFQLVVGGWEVVNAYSELIDPIDQASRFEEQVKAQQRGDIEAHGKDDEYVKALEYGCPPCSGWGMGVDRVVALLTQQRNLRDVVLFPLLKPSERATKATREPKVPKNKKSTSVPLVPLVPLVPSLHIPMASATPDHLLQHAEYGHLLSEAHALLTKHADKTRAHLIATGAAMEALAKKFGGDPATWKVAGMLHDLDWDHLEKDAEEHCGKTLEQMLAGIAPPAELLADIRSHYEEKYGGTHPLDTMLRKCLYCSDELTGFILAVTFVRPSKNIADVEVSSIKKKMKDKAFARQVKREQIMKCQELLGIPLDEFIGIVLRAMQGVSEEIGL